MFDTDDCYPLDPETTDLFPVDLVCQIGICSMKAEYAGTWKTGALVGYCTSHYSEKAYGLADVYILLPQTRQWVHVRH